MKRLFLRFAIALFLGAAWAQDGEDALAQIRVLVTDDAGAPVPKVEVAVTTYSNWIPGGKGAGRDEYNTVVGTTGTNGMMVLNLKSATGRFGCMALPRAGYRFDKGVEYVFTNTVAGRWAPWSPLVPVVLKRLSHDSDPLASPLR